MNLERWKVIFVTGKGGVGKTTFSTSLAFYLASKGKKTLLCDLALDEAISRMLGIRKAGYSIKKVEDNFFLIHIQPEKSLEEYVKLRLRYRILYLPLMSSNIYKQFVRSTPGLKEITVIGKIWYEYQNSKFNHIIVDMPPTGHALPMLKLPEVYMNSVRLGPVYNDSRKLYEMLKEDSALIPVTIPEEMAVNETLEIIEMARANLPLQIPAVVLNRFFDLFSEEEMEEVKNAFGEMIHQYIKEKAERSRRLRSFLKEKVAPIPLIEIPEVPSKRKEIFDRIGEKMEKEGI